MDHAPEGYVERQIREAMEEGAFDALPGRGAPLGDLPLHSDPAWWARRRMARERVRNRALQTAAEVQREVGRLLTVADEESLRTELSKLQERIDRANAPLPAKERLEPLDVPGIVELWRRMARVRR